MFLNYVKITLSRAAIVPPTSGLSVQRAIHYTTEAVAMMMKIVLYISNPTPTPNPTPNPIPNPKTNPNVTNPTPNPTLNLFF